MSRSSVRRFARAAAVSALVSVWLTAVDAQQTRTVTSGVYTGAQAARGEAIYKEKCAVCHGAALGGAQAPALVGDAFTSTWAGPLSELVNKIRSTMPANDPGKLTVAQSTDIVAYMLQTAKFPAGSAELAADESALKQVALPGGQNAVPVQTAASSHVLSFPPAGNLAQVMRGILFPSSNLIFNVQGRDPATPRPPVQTGAGGFPWADWGAGIYSAWEMVDNAAISLAESAPLMLTPGRRCENGKLVPVDEPDWIKYTLELAEAGKAAYKASQTRKQDVVSDVTDQIATSCSHCHEAYRDKPVRGPRSVTDPSNKAARCVK